MRLRYQFLLENRFSVPHMSNAKEASLDYLHYQKTGQRSRPKVPAAVAAGTQQQYRLQQQLIPLALDRPHGEQLALGGGTNRFQCGSIGTGLYHHPVPNADAGIGTGWWDQPVAIVLQTDPVPADARAKGTGLCLDPVLLNNIQHRVIGTNRCLLSTPINTPTSPPSKLSRTHCSWQLSEGRGGEFLFFIKKDQLFFSITQQLVFRTSYHLIQFIYVIIIFSCSILLQLYALSIYLICEYYQIIVFICFINLFDK